MSSSKEDLALKWAQISEKKKRHAEAQKRYRSKKEFRRGQKRVLRTKLT